MASVAIPSFEDAVSTVERWAQEKATDNEIVEFLEQLIKALDDPASVEIFKASFGGLGTRVKQSVEAFVYLRTVLDKVIEEHGKEYPGLIPFQKEWHTCTTTWMGYVETSRDFAMINAAEYEDYTLYLRSIPEAKTKEELLQLARELEEFAKRKSASIPADFIQRLLALERQVQNFQKGLNEYLDEQKVRLPAEVESLLRAIESLASEIAAINERIKRATLGLGIAPWWELVGAIVPDTVLAVLARKRAVTQAVFNNKIAQLKFITAKLPALEQIRVQLAIVALTFKFVVEDMSVFFEIWNAFHNEALDFANALKTVDNYEDLSQVIKLRIKLALATSNPLQEGLKEYTAYLHL